jgi:2,4-dienoyl-CoA reductase (NADPH2)
MMLQPITCLVNPRVNRERETELTPAPVKKNILVAGGGPAGMECAWVAAHRGHQVTLCEETAALGGQANLASIPPGREEWSEMVAYLVQQLQNKGVEVMLSQLVSPEIVEELNPDVLVMATGAEQVVPAIAGVDSPNVVLAWDVLTEKVSTGKRVAVVGGGAVGIETASFLAESGKQVMVIEMLERCGTDIGISTRWTLLQQADRLGVQFMTASCVKEITPQGLKAESENGLKDIVADTIVLAVGSRAHDELEDFLATEGIKHKFEIRKIGDCASPRKALDAIHEGFELGRTL